MKKVFIGIVLLLFIQCIFCFINAQTALEFNLTSDFGPRSIDGVYDWHNGLDFGCNNSHKIVKAIEGGDISINSNSTLNTISIGDWQYLHCYKHINGEGENIENPYSAAKSDGIYRVYCGKAKLNYIVDNRILKETVTCIIVWENDNLKNIYCNSTKYYLTNNSSEKIFAKKNIVEGSPFAITSGFGKKGNGTLSNSRYPKHLHLQLSGYRNPYLKYLHDSSNYKISIIKPLKKENDKEIIIKHGDGSELLHFKIDTKAGLDLNKVKLFLFNALAMFLKRVDPNICSCYNILTKYR